MSYYQDLEIWKKSILIVKTVYKLVESFPKSELYSLVDQMKRASISISSNIAEGSGRGSAQDNLRFLYMAQGSCLELETQLMISEELGFANKENSENLKEEIIALEKMLFKFILAKKNSGKVE